MKNICKRVLAMILALSMCMSMISTTAFSAYDEPSLSTEGMEHIVRIERPDPICGQEEHSHSDACYESEAILTCEDETEDHVHTDACYQTLIEGRLVCELEEHTHSDACYPVVEVPEFKTLEVAEFLKSVKASENGESQGDGTVCQCGETTEAEDHACACEDEDSDECACDCETCNLTQGNETVCRCGETTEAEQHECACEDEDSCACECETCNPTEVYSLTVTQSTNVAEDQIIVLDDVITYTITVVNDGNQTLTNVAITVTLEGITVYSDNLSGVSYDEENSTFTIARIDPCEDGCYVQFSFTYTVTEEDIQAGEIANTVTASFGGSDGETVTVENEITTKVESPKEEVTYSFRIRKISDWKDGDGNEITLSGAEFTLYAEDGSVAVEGLVSDWDGMIEVNGLVAGTYVLEETKAPEGHVKTADSWTIYVGAEAPEAANGGDGTKASSFVDGVLTVVNERFSYKVTYNANGGNEGTFDVWYGLDDVADLTQQTATNSEGLIFVGWSKEDRYDVWSPLTSKDYRFDGYLSTVEFIGEDITVYALWSEDRNGNNVADVIEEHWLYYNANGGDLGEVPASTSNHRMNAEVELMPKTEEEKPKFPGVVFVGWTEGPNDYDVAHPATEAPEVKLVTIVKFNDQDIEVYAVWAVDANDNKRPDYLDEQFSVTYRWDSLPEGANVTLPAAETRLPDAKVTVDGNYTAESSVTVARDTGDGYRVSETYTFSGWSSEDVEIAADGTFTMPAWDVELVGEWTFADSTIMDKDETLYTVEHRYYTSTDGANWNQVGVNTVSGVMGKVTDTITVDQLDKVLSYRDSSYAFVSSEPAEGITLGLDSERNIITLIYHRTPVIYTLNYDANESDVENVPAPQSVTAYADAYVFTVSGQKPTREGYTFLGWATTPDATEINVGVSYTVTKSVSEDEVVESYSATLYAVWAVDVDGDNIPDSRETHYTVTYRDGVDGAAFAEQVFEYQHAGDATPSFRGTPTRSGYTFVRWDPTVSRTVSGDAIYVAQWRVRTTTSGSSTTSTPSPTPSEEVEEDLTDSQPPLGEMPEIIEREPEEEEDFEEPDVPLSALPEEFEDFEDEDFEDEDFEEPDVPLAALPSGFDEEDLADGDVPLADVPQTGDNSHVWTALALLSGAGLLGLSLDSKKRKEDAE